MKNTTYINYEELYFPVSIEQLILPKRILTEIFNAKQKVGYNFLFYSSPGTGKSTTARLITKGDDVLYLSGSNDFNIKTIRDKIMPFASGHSALRKQKTIIIEEAENIRDNLQDAFKIILDQCKDINFIFITNEFDKMNEAVVSRCTPFDYDFVDSEMSEQKGSYVKFAVDLCKEQQFTFEPKALKELCLRNFPDFRHLLVEFQKLHDSEIKHINEKIIKLISQSDKQDHTLYDIVMSPAVNGENLYKGICLYKGKEKEALISLGEPFFAFLNEQNRFSDTLQVAMIITKYSDSYTTSINKFVTLLAAIVELKSIFK